MRPLVVAFVTVTERAIFPSVTLSVHDPPSVPGVRTTVLTSIGVSVAMRAHEGELVISASVNVCPFSENSIGTFDPGPSVTYR